MVFSKHCNLIALCLGDTSLDQDRWKMNIIQNIKGTDTFIIQDSKGTDTFPNSCFWKQRSVCLNLIENTEMGGDS